MDYKKLFQSNGVTNVGLIGTGAFGRSFLVQSRLIPDIRVPVVCDQDIAVAKDACLQAGVPLEDLKVCRTESDANATIASGKTAVVSDALLLMDLPIEVVIEASGMPEAGAIHARTAMVNCLRRSDEISFAGGVFVIVKCRERETWQLLKNKGHLANRSGTRAMIFRPYHLLGVETATSVPLDKMTILDKIAVMEKLWDDLCRDPESIGWISIGKWTP